MKSGDGNDFSKKDLILQTTLELIKNEGIEQVTVRKIANRANVNAALINYHFGSKDKLLNDAIRMLVNSFRESFDVLEELDIEPRERLKRFFAAYVRLIKKYPFIIERFMKQDPFIFESQKEYFHFIRAIGLKRLQATIRELTGEEDPRRLTIMLSHLLGAVILPILIEPLYEDVTGYPMPELEERIDLLLERYL